MLSLNILYAHAYKQTFVKYDEEKEKIEIVSGGRSPLNILGWNTMSNEVLQTLEDHVLKQISTHQFKREGSYSYLPQKRAGEISFNSVEWLNTVTICNSFTKQTPSETILLPSTFSPSQQSQWLLHISSELKWSREENLISSRVVCKHLYRAQITFNPIICNNTPCVNIARLVWGLTNWNLHWSQLLVFTKGQNK